MYCLWLQFTIHMDCVLCISLCKQYAGNSFIVLGGHCCRNWGQNLREQYGSACVLLIHIMCTRGVVMQTWGKAKMNCRKEWEVWAGGGGRTSRQNKCAHTPKTHTVQNKLVAPKKEKREAEASWLVSSHSAQYSCVKSATERISPFYWG